MRKPISTALLRARVQTAYEQDGMGRAVELYAELTKGKGTTEYCTGCENTVPSIKHECLICGQKTTIAQDKKGLFIIVERSGGYFNAVMARDEFGSGDGTMTFDTESKAHAYAVENCQKGFFKVIQWE